MPRGVLIANRAGTPSNESLPPTIPLSVPDKVNGQAANAIPPIFKNSRFEIFFVRIAPPYHVTDTNNF
jgi:hypothetical protein